ncbi:AfsR/SARP family transcriptional regulator [Actinocorallia lasiicapitis]
MSLRGARLQVLLAVLALRPGETVNKEQLIEELWPEEMPRRVENALQALITRLRRSLRPHLGNSALPWLVTTGAGYQLDVAPGLIDAKVFADVYTDAQVMLARDPVAALRMLESAIALWQGPALDGIVGGQLCRSASLELDEMRLGAVEASVQARVILGDSTVIPELKGLVTLHPWREKLTEMLMIALYRAGRQVEAMETYRQARNRFVEELGLEPSPQLRDQARAILNQKPDMLVIGGQ